MFAARAPPCALLANHDACQGGLFSGLQQGRLVPGRVDRRCADGYDARLRVGPDDGAQARGGAEGRNDARCLREQGRDLG